MGLITHLGTNYVLVELGEDRSVRKWLTDVERIEESAGVETKESSIVKAMKQRSSYKTTA